jgi:predicted RNA-binding protein
VPRRRYRSNSRVVLGDVSVLEVTTESFRATSAFIRNNGRVITGDVSVLEVTVESYQATSAF